MNDFIYPEERKRGKTLIVVEGKYEKDTLFRTIFKVFPELDVDNANILVYGTNIYALYDAIENLHSDDWESQEVDIPLMLSKENNDDKVNHINDFKDIFLIFDHEKQDPRFSEEKIYKLQNYFNDSADKGMLYINYPMVESMVDIEDPLDTNTYLSKKYRMDIQSGEEYKSSIKNTPIYELMAFPQKIRETLKEKFEVLDDIYVEECINKLLSLTRETCILENLSDILYLLKPANRDTAKYQFMDWIKKSIYYNSGTSYWEFTRNIIIKIIQLNIIKSGMIQGVVISDNDLLLDMFEKIDLDLILKIQNELIRNENFVWVLNTCIMYVPQYNRSLIL